MRIFFCLMLFLFHISCVNEKSFNVKEKTNIEETLIYEKLILGKWVGTDEEQVVHFVMMDNKSLYFYSESIDEMNLFKDSQAKGGIVKPIKWSVSENKYLTFNIYDWSQNYEIIDLSPGTLKLKNMLKDQTLILKKADLTPYEKDYIASNNYNK